MSATFEDFLDDFICVQKSRTLNKVEHMPGRMLCLAAAWDAEQHARDVEHFNEFGAQLELLMAKMEAPVVAAEKNDERCMYQWGEAHGQQMMDEWNDASAVVYQQPNVAVAAPQDENPFDGDAFCRMMNGDELHEDMSFPACLSDQYPSLQF